MSDRFDPAAWQRPEDHFEDEDTLIRGRVGETWLTAIDASYCTQVPAGTPPEIRRALLVYLADAAAESVEAGLNTLLAEHGGEEAVAETGGEFYPSGRRVFEELSWISPESVFAVSG